MLDALAAAREAEATLWSKGGDSSPAKALARRSGSTVRQAKAAIKTAKRLRNQPKTAAAARKGELSPEQASLISEAAEADPGAESKLLETAQGSSLGELMEECARVRAAADRDAEARRQRIHRNRFLRRYTDREGAGNIHVRDTVDVIAAIMAVLGPMADQLSAEAKARGEHEPEEAYSADALALLARLAAAGWFEDETDDIDPTISGDDADGDGDPGVTGGAPSPDGRAGGGPGQEGDNAGREGAGSAPTPGRPSGAPATSRRWHNAKILGRFDVAAMVRGYPVGGEVCELVGYGPIPVEMMRDLIASGNPFLVAIATKGVEVVNVWDASSPPTSTAPWTGCMRPARPRAAAGRHRRPTTVTTGQRPTDRYSVKRTGTAVATMRSRPTGAGHWSRALACVSSSLPTTPDIRRTPRPPRPEASAKPMGHCTTYPVGPGSVQVQPSRDWSMIESTSERNLEASIRGAPRRRSRPGNETARRKRPQRRPRILSAPRFLTHTVRNGVSVFLVSQTIDVEVGPGAISPEANADITKFETMLARYLADEIDEDSFRIFRLNNGIYGQRQGGHNQMVRIKVPYGSITPEQLEKLADIATDYSRGWGHITTRQNIQFHFVQLERVPQLMRDLATVGLTTREACGDTVRNITGCHLAGACPYEVLDISPWAEAAFRHFLRNPYAQRLPRKFKINFSGCVTDCGQAMFNDVGVIAVNRPRPDGTTEAGFRVFIAGGLGANPHPALALEEFTPKEKLIATIEAILRTFDHYGNRDNKLRARMKWLVETMGIDDLRERILKERRLLVASTTWVGGIPEYVQQYGDGPAGVGGDHAPTPMGWGTNVVLQARDPMARWDQANVVRGNAKGTVSAYAYAPLGDITADQFRALAAVQRELGAELRVTNRQNIVFRGLTEEQLTPLYQQLGAIGMAEPGAELARDVVSCPGADTCNLAVTQSRGLADHIGEALEAAGLADVGGVRVNISGCTNSCGQHHVADIGFVGVERRAHGQAAPGYLMLLGGHIGETKVEFGHKALRVPAKNAGAATVRVVGRFANERAAGETFAEWLGRVGGAATIGAELKELDVFPLPEENPDFYVDFDETGPYVAEVGAGECAGS